MWRLTEAQKRHDEQLRAVGAAIVDLARAGVPEEELHQAVARWADGVCTIVDAVLETLDDRTVEGRRAIERVFIDVLRVNFPSDAYPTTLPARSESQSGEPIETGESVGVHGSVAPPRVLVAEDNADICLLVELHLRRLGSAVVTATDGREALRRIRSEHFDLVILDVKLPELDGLEVLDAVRDDRQTRTIPVILLTANARHTDVADGLSRGATSYLTKPFTRDELTAAIQRSLNPSPNHDRG